MRVGKNPEKGAPPLAAYGRHRVIVPVYVPHQGGYFERAIEVIGLCLQTLHRSTAGRAAITVISNGAAAPVVEELERGFRAGWFDQLVLHERNRGKVDAMLAAARASYEPFVTLSDADVLFRPGWLEAVEQVFRTFPEAGVVAPFTMPPLAWINNASTMVDASVRRELGRAKVVTDESLDQLTASLGHPTFVPDDLRQSQLVVRRGGVLACVGATHIVSTWRREVIEQLPSTPSLTSVAGTSERRWMDEPSDRLGVWRLSTPTYWACHMGNVPEAWMAEELERMTAATRTAGDETTDDIPPLRWSWTRRLPMAVRRALAARLQHHHGTQRALLWRETHAPASTRS